MNGKGLGPAHDRIELTQEEMRVIARLEHDLDAARGPSATGKLAPRVRPTPRAYAYLLCMRFRRLAIWLMLLAGVGLAVAITTSLALATVCAAAWTIGFAALLTEVGAAFRRRPRDGGR